VAVAGGLHLRGSQMLAAEVPETARTRHFHLDHLGTPRLITGNGGAELSRHNYQTFGVEIASPSASADGASREKKQFTGHERDAESLDYMHARFYAPYMGRFLCPDPVMHMKRAVPQPQRWNRYAYAINNPVRNPDGRADDDFRCYECMTPEMNAAFREGRAGAEPRDFVDTLSGGRVRCRLGDQGPRPSDGRETVRWRESLACCCRSSVQVN